MLVETTANYEHSWISSPLHLLQSFPYTSIMVDLTPHSILLHYDDTTTIPNLSSSTRPLPCISSNVAESLSSSSQSIISSSS